MKPPNKAIRSALITAKKFAKNIDPAFDRVTFADGGAVDDTDDGSVFYSGLQDAITNAKQKAAPAQDWKNIIKPGSAPGVTQSEIDATGLHDFLDQQQGQVPRDALVNHVRSNVPKINDTWKASALSIYLPEKERREYDELHGKFMNNPLMSSEAEKARISELGRKALAAKDASGHSAQTKFHGYQTPGGSNYKELLMRLPSMNHEEAATAFKGHGISLDTQFGTASTNRPDVHKLRKWGSDSGDKSNYIDPKSLSPEQKTLWKNLHAERYKSPHWSESNILAHVRMHDRKGPNGEKLLHIDEMQSDWHQHGRKYGYKSDHKPKFTVHLGDKQLSEHGTKDEAIAARHAAGRDARVMEHLHPNAGDSRAVPDAPFRDTKEWTALAMKRVMRHAADNGYKGITWTTGDQQADRYDLSKQVKSIHTRPHLNGKGERVVQINGMDGHPFYASAFDKSGKLISKGQFEGKDLDEVVGKDMAEKMMADYDKGHVLYAGNDLKVGGAGMREYYDKIMPSVANKLGKEHGVKHSMIQYPKDESKRGLRIDTDDDEGRPIHRIVDEDNPIDHTEDMGLAPGDTRPRVLSRHRDLEEARHELEQAKGGSDLKLHYMPITPSMKGKKHKLFKRGGLVSPQVDTAMRVAHKHMRSK